MPTALPAYAELHALSNFSFLRGASRPEELVERAHELGYTALAITDECSLAGVVRAHTEAKAQGLKLLIGSEFVVQANPPFKLVVLACHREGYASLSTFITQLRRASPKGTYSLSMAAITAPALSGCLVLMIPDRLTPFADLFSRARWLQKHFKHRSWIAVELLHEIDDQAWLHKMRELQRMTAVPLVAAGDVHMHVRSRKPLQDVLTATRLNLPLSECGEALQANAERHLRSRLRLANLYPPDLLAATLQVAEQCRFSLDELRYDYPEEVVPKGQNAATWLRCLTEQGAITRFPDGLPDKVRHQIEHELALISELQYEKYFLTVHDIVRFARERGILCQGRGSAANSAVCYCLGITEVDPARATVLFERFISRERNEPPDIDVDFEHERREEVMQYLYNKYGRDRAALTCTVVSYRTRSAIRDVGRALGFDPEVVDRIAKSHQWWDDRRSVNERLIEAALDPTDLAAQQWLLLSAQVLGFPRHLSQHTGGFVISGGPLSRLVPVENASMPDRTVIQWDKDDLDAMGLLKVDVLALGMLTAIQRALSLISQQRGQPFRMQDIPSECPQVYEMFCQADTIGVFQIESRAQQSMLPRLQPRKFYDLVIEVAIVRPGPIQGGMVHPYLKRRQGLEEAHFPKEELRAALGRTLGIPIFQEQVMQVVMIAAEFTAGEADGLRRSMAAWKRKGGLEKYQHRIVAGMTKRGYEEAFALALCEQIKGFGEYGFPESHAASFALLVYVSGWIKCHEPAIFLVAMLNSQPMGFYSPSQLVQDARRHEVVVRSVDVSYSAVETSLEHAPPASTSTSTPSPSPASPQAAVRLGLHQVHGLSPAAAQRIITARQQQPFADVDDLARRAQLTQADVTQLASADALQSLAGHRRQQVWQASALRAAPPLLKEAPIHEEALCLPQAPEGEEILFDYAATGLSLRRHPMALLRDQVAQRRMLSSSQLRELPNGRLARACGLVTMRQQPGTAKGTVFVSLEDEHGSINVIVWRDVRDQFRPALLQSKLLAVCGVWQRQGEVCHLVARRLDDWSPLLGRLDTRSRNFR
jgi:error-prone DNA polymerase